LVYGYYGAALAFRVPCRKWRIKFKELDELKTSFEVMNNDTHLNLGQEIYKLFYDLKKSCKTVTLINMHCLEEVLRQELSECVLAIWCSGCIGYKDTDYRLIFRSVDKCGHYVGILHELGKISSSDYEKWSGAIQSILEGLKIILDNPAFFYFVSKSSPLSFENADSSFSKEARKIFRPSFIEAFLPIVRDILYRQFFFLEAQHRSLPTSLIAAALIFVFFFIVYIVHSIMVWGS
jgi:hypothetical protein